MGKIKGTLVEKSDDFLRSIGPDCGDLITSYKYQMEYIEVVEEIKQRFRHKYLNIHLKFLNEYHASLFDNEGRFNHYFYDNESIPYMKDYGALFLRKK